MVMIAICDDEVAVGAELERILIDIFSKLGIKHKIDVFFTGDGLYRYMADGLHFDLVFLDIQFASEETNGVDVGRLIRNEQQNHTTQIVYISWEKKYAMKLFEIRPINFLTKPLEYGAIENTVKTYLKISGILSGELTYKKGHDIFKAKVKDIAYLESLDRKIIIHFTNGKNEEFYGSLKAVYNEQLERFDFLFIHASYAVNYDYVTAVKFNQVFLKDNGTPLPISPNRRSKVREVYFAIMKNRKG